MVAMILVAENGGLAIFARIGFVRGLNRQVQLMFDALHKDTHAGERKLACDR
jgi:hypothetical protein